MSSAFDGQMWNGHNGTELVWRLLEFGSATFMLLKLHCFSYTQLPLFYYGEKTTEEFRAFVTNKSFMPTLVDERFEDASDAIKLASGGLVCFATCSRTRVSGCAILLN